MEDLGHFQNQLVNGYADGGVSDGSCGVENYSSSDSTYSGEFVSDPRPFSSPSSSGDGMERFNVPQQPSPCPFVYYQGINTNMQNSDWRSVGLNRAGTLRNLSVSSPSPQQVSFLLEPFLHVGPPSPWQFRGWVGADVSDSSSKSPPPQDLSHFQFPPFQQTPGPCPSPNLFPENYRLVIPSAIQPRGLQPILTACNDPQCELRRNGRDVEMDDLDRLRVRLRDGRQRPPSSLYNGTENGPDQEEPQSLKYRLAQVRAKIREELAQEAAAREARGLFGSRRRDRNGKKCKFCLKKNEQPDIVMHHNLKDSRNNVTCPILQQYRCDVCHATGRKAHTIKYCPLNNPDTPHEVILEARWKVFNRNRHREW